MKERKKIVFYTELVYCIAIFFLAWGSALMVHGKLGVSVVVAPSYVLHLRYIENFSFFTYGFAQYFIQAAFLLVLCFIIRRFHWTYIGSFLTAFIFGVFLDFNLYLLSEVNLLSIASRIIFFSFGLILCAITIAMLFRTYLPIFVYELVVRELSTKYHLSLHHVKIAYDIFSCLLSIFFSFSLLGFWNVSAIGVGTVISAFLNGPIIAYTTRFLDSHFIFKARYPKFEKVISTPKL